jgi:hypothetical protein
MDIEIPGDMQEHERFMREAIDMVTLPNPTFLLNISNNFK